MQVQFRSYINTGRVRGKLVGAVGERTGRVVRSIYNQVIKLSPVLTGNFRASWNVSMDAPEYIMETSGSEDNVVQPRPFPNIRIRQLGVVYITNGQPYAKMLEYGYSAQAPAGVLRVVLARYR